MDNEKKDLILKIINIYETGTAKGNYSDVSIFADGTNQTKQITYGRSQTTEQGHLSNLLDRYISKSPSSDAAKVIKGVLPKIKKGVSQVENKRFIEALKTAGHEVEMIEAQDEFFDEIYWTPAFEFFTSNGFTMPLSMLVIYDSFVHSGGILWTLRERFLEPVPSKRGNEKNWIRRYVEVRFDWLHNHSRPILRKTTYRCSEFLKLINSDNWDLTNVTHAHGVPIE